MAPRFVTVAVVLLAVACVLVGGTEGPFILGAGGLALGFFLAGVAWASIVRPRPEMHVLIERSCLEHHLAVKVEDRRGWITYERVDLREDGYEEKLAVAVAEMKHKLRTIEAAKRIAGEP